MQTILLVEDNELNRDMLSRRLERKGYTIAIAVDGGQAEAVNMAATTPYGLIPMDMSLPVMDGREATRQIRATGSSVPLIALTAHAMDGYEATRRIRETAGLQKTPVIAVTASSFRDEEAPTRKVCDGFIRKPFNSAELIAERKRFLRPATVSEPMSRAAEKPGETDVAPPAPVSDALLARRPAIIAKLRQELESVWPRLPRTMDKAEIEELTGRLHTLATDGEFPDLLACAARLDRDVEAFDVDQLVKALQQFPAVWEPILNPMTEHV